MESNLYKFKKVLDDRNIIFSINGPMSHSIIEGVGNAIRTKLLEGEESDKKASLKVFSIFVEQVENLINYSDDKTPDNTKMANGLIAVGKDNEGFFICSGNKIKNEKVEKLKSNLNRLIAMDKDELKTYYKQKRREGSDEESKGAGIGFIEMARKASKPIKFQFEKLDDTYSFFTTHITI